MSTLLLTQKRVGKGAQITKKRKKTPLTRRLAVVSSPTLPTLSSPPFSSSSVCIPVVVKVVVVVAILSVKVLSGQYFKN